MCFILVRVWRAHIEVVKHVKVLFSLRKSAFKIAICTTSYRSAIVPESPNKLKRFLLLGGVQGSGEKGCMLDSRLLFGHCSITLLFLPLPEPTPSPSLTEVLAYAASPASLCATSTCRLRHQRSMSVSASGHPKMVLPPIDSEGDTFKAM